MPTHTYTRLRYTSLKAFSQGSRGASITQPSVVSSLGGGHGDDRSYQVVVFVVHVQMFL